MQPRSCAHCAAFSPPPLPSHPPVHLHLSLANTMCSRASCNPAAQSPIHAPGRRNKRNANSSTIPNSPSSFCKASRRQNATHIPKFTFSICPSSYAAGPAKYTKSPIQGEYTTWTIEKPLRRAFHLLDHSIKTTNVIGTGYGFGLP